MSHQYPHTPGPWRTKANSIVGPDGKTVGAANRNRRDGTKALRAGAEWVGNAALMAAAPAMYDLLRVLRADRHHCPEGCVRCARINATLASAVNHFDDEITP